MRTRLHACAYMFARLYALICIERERERERKRNSQAVVSEADEAVMA